MDAQIRHVAWNLTVSNETERNEKETSCSIAPGGLIIDFDPDWERTRTVCAKTE